MSKLERIAYIDRRIHEHGCVSLAEVAERFEISERQIKRDIEYLRNRLDAPIVWDAKARRYRYEEAFQDLAFADEKALLFFVFARAAARTLAYVPLAEPGPLESLRALVPPALRGLEEAVRYELPGFEPADDELLALLLASIQDGVGIAATYRDLGGRESRRLLSPLRIVNYAGTWYCVAFDPAIKELRTFRLSRFLHAAPSTEELGDVPSASAVDAFLGASYGMFKGQGDKRARLRFSGRAREIVRRELWHPDQSVTEGRDDQTGPWVELDLPVSQWDEILGRLLRFGAEAEAVSPPEFRSRWLAAIDAMAEVATKARAGRAEDEGP